MRVQLHTRARARAASVCSQHRSSACLGTRVCVFTACRCRVRPPPPPTPQQLLPQHRALTLDGASQLSLYTSPSLPNISLGLQATVTVTNSHLNVSGAGAGGLAWGPHGGEGRGGKWHEDLMSHRGGLGTWHLVGLAWGPCACGVTDGQEWGGGVPSQEPRYLGSPRIPL